jgi:hypothetical protein
MLDVCHRQMLTVIVSDAQCKILESMFLAHLSELKAQGSF